MTDNTMELLLIAAIEQIALFESAIDKAKLYDKPEDVDTVVHDVFIAGMVSQVDTMNRQISKYLASRKVFDDWLFSFDIYSVNPYTKINSVYEIKEFLEAAWEHGYTTGYDKSYEDGK